MSIIFVHEIGHFFAARFYGWNSGKIYIYPLGGVTKFNEDVNRKLIEEFVIVLMGPVFQIIYSLFLICSGCQSSVKFSLFLLSFNLLPIYPLDGGKIVNIFLGYFFPYRISSKINVMFSFSMYFILCIYILKYNRNIFLLFAFFLLFFKILEERKNLNSLFNKFLLERYLKNYRFNKIIYINNVYNMYKNKTHFFLVNNEILTEKSMLKKFFDNRFSK
jgi:stage IV sporulation protein FB